MYANPSCRNKYPIFLLAYDVIFIDVTFLENEKFVKKIDMSKYTATTFKGF